MKSRIVLLSLVGLAFVLRGGLASAEPKIVTDIPPIHSLVSQVMQGVGEPSLLLSTNASPHDFSLRPSQARLLSQADFLVWVSPVLTPWLDTARVALVPKANSVVLEQVNGTVVLASRELESFAKVSDGHEHDHHDHAEKEHAHDHGGIDPHLWLDPQNAKIWLPHIADALGAADPENAGLYKNNAGKAVQALDALTDKIDAQLASVKERPFVIFHDAIYAFESRFGLKAVGAVSLSDAAPPSASAIQVFRDAIKENQVGCLFYEGPTAPRLLSALTEGTDIRAVEIDPLGRRLAAGVDQYERTLLNLANAMARCLGT